VPADADHRNVLRAAGYGYAWTIAVIDAASVFGDRNQMIHDDEIIWEAEFALGS
jgi:hypothetical protein